MEFDSGPRRSPPAVFIKIHSARQHCKITSGVKAKPRKKSTSARCSISKVAPASIRIPKADQMDPGGRKKTIECIYQPFKKISCGADGFVSGITCSNRPSCLAIVLDELIVHGSELIEFGAGDGPPTGEFWWTCNLKGRKQGARINAASKRSASICIERSN